MPDPQGPDFSGLSDEDLHRLAGGDTSQMILSDPHKPMSIQSTEAAHAMQREGVNDIWNRLAFGGVAATAGGLMGGPMGALGGGIMGTMFPPENAADAAGWGLGAGMGAAYGAASKLGSPLVRIGAQAGIGLTQEAANEALHGQKPGQAGWLGPALSLLPAGMQTMVEGSQGGYFVSQQQAKLRQQLDALAASSGEGPIEQRSGQTPLMGKTKDQLESEFNQYQNNTAALKYMRQDLQKVDAQRQALLTQYGGPDDPQEMIKLNAKFARIAKLSGGDPFDPGYERIGEIKKQMGQVQQQDMLPDAKTSQLGIMQDQIDSIGKQIAQNKVQQIMKSNSATTLDQLSQSTKATKELMDLHDQLENEVNTNTFKNPFLKNLVQSDPNTPLTLRSFVNNLVNSDAEHIQGLYDYLGQDKTNGPTQIQAVQKAIITEFLQQAWDPKSQQWSNLGKVSDPNGTFSMPKMQAVFGGGVEGQQNLGVFKQVMSDFTSLQKQQADNSQLLARIPSPGAAVHRTAIAAAVPIFFAVRDMAGSAPGEYASAVPEAAVALSSTPKLIMAALQNPAIAKGLHEYAANGGQGMTNAALSNWVKKNSTQY